VRPEPKRDASDEQKQEDAFWGLTQIGAASLLREWIEDRPVDVSASFLKALSHSDHKVRRGAASYLNRFSEGLFEPIHFAIGYYSDTHERHDPRKLREGMAIIISAVSRDRLGELAKCDPDETVRKLATDAIRNANVLRK